MTKKRCDSPLKNMKHKKLIIVLIILLALVTVCTASAYGILSHYFGKMDYQPVSDVVTMADASEIESILSEETVTAQETPKDKVDSVLNRLRSSYVESEDFLLSDKAVWNALLIGTDGWSKTASSRSDSMILVSVSKKSSTILLTSIMRDTYLYIPDVGYNRLNAAYAYGGASLLVKTIEKNFGINIDNYAQVNFNAFAEVVDKIGGVDVILNESEIDEINNAYIDYIAFSGSSNEAKVIDSSLTGTSVSLDGVQALSFARIRHVGNADFERTQRQRTVLLAIVDKIKSYGLRELNDLMELILPQIKTDIKKSKCIAVLLNASSYLDYDIKTMRIPCDGSYSFMTVNGMSVLGIDIGINMSQWKKVVYGK